MASHDRRSVQCRKLLSRAGVIRWRGNLDMERGPNGLVPRRLPAWTKPQVPGFVELMATMPSGVRTEFVTSSRAIELEVLLTGLELLPFNPAESGRLSDVDAAFDLVIDDGDVWTVRAKGNSKFLVNRDRLDESEFVADAPSTIRFDGVTGREIVTRSRVRSDDGTPAIGMASIDSLRWTNRSWPVDRGPRAGGSRGNTRRTSA